MSDTDKLAQLEARVKQLESYLGHIHPIEVDGAFKEYPKQVGAEVAQNAEEEKAILAKGGAKSAPVAASVA